MALVIVGAGILGLSVAEAASRNGGETVIVIEDPDNPGASYAAAAQLGLKGQSVSKSEEFRLKIAGQRCYEQWIASWGLNSAELAAVQQWFRRGTGRDHVLSETEFAEQKRRIEKHEGEVFPTFFGPSLVYSQSDRKALSYLLEVSLDARKMLGVLRCVLQRRGVQFEKLNALDLNCVEEVLGNVRSTDGARGCSVVVCAGASTFEVLSAWGIKEDAFATRLIPPHKRVNWGATVVCPSSALLKAASTDSQAKLDFNKNVIEGFLDRSQNEIVAVTQFAEKLLVTSLSAPFDCTNGSSIATQARQFHEHELNQGAPLHRLFKAQCQKLQGLFEKHGFKRSIPDHESRADSGLCAFRVGLRLRAAKTDVVLEKLRNSRMRTAAQVIVFTGANRSGYLYGPALAHKVLALHRNSQEFA